MKLYTPLILAILCGSASLQSADAAPRQEIPAQTQHIDGTVPIFCRDSDDVYQPIVRTNYARLQNSYLRQFGWESSLTTTSNRLGRLVFSSNGTEEAAETISYIVEPHAGGIALLHMKVRLDGVSEDLSGSEMCWKTWGIINAP